MPSDEVAPLNRRLFGSWPINVRDASSFIFRVCIRKLKKPLHSRYSEAQVTADTGPRGRSALFYLLPLPSRQNTFLLPLECLCNQKKRFCHPGASP